MARKNAIEASLEELEAYMAKENAKLEEIRAQMAPLNAALQAAAARRDMYRDSIAKLRKDDIAYVMSDINAYTQWQQMLPKQTFSNGYWSSTKEQAWKLKLKKGETASQELKDFVERWIKVAKLARFGVFRYDLSERGIWEVELIDNVWHVYDATSWDYKRNKRYEFKTSDFDALITYMSENHYYEREDGYCDDNEDDNY